LNQVDLGSYTNSFSSSVASHGVTLVKLAANATAPTQTVYEADATANVVTGGAVVEACDYEWGYSCLDGNEAGYIGNTGTITLNNVNASTAGAYNMTIYGMVNGTRYYDVSVNGGAASAATLTGTSFAIPSVAGMQVQLNEGANSIEFSNASGWTPDLDHIVISMQGAQTSSFNIAYPISSVTVSAGKAGTASLTLVPTGGFTGTVSVSCTLPKAMTGATCSSATASLSDGNSATISLTITTTPAQSASLTKQKNIQAVLFQSKVVHISTWKHPRKHVSRVCINADRIRRCIQKTKQKKSAFLAPLLSRFSGDYSDIRLWKRERIWWRICLFRSAWSTYWIDGNINFQHWNYALVDGSQFRKRLYC
jgi:hypothetical protein